MKHHYVFLVRLAFPLITHCHTIPKNFRALLHPKNGLNEIYMTRRSSSYTKQKDLYSTPLATPCREGTFDEVLSLTKNGSIPMDSGTYGRVLQLCINTKALAEGKKVHSHVINSGFQFNIFLQNRIVEMYAKCGELDVARQVFDKMSKRNIFSWNTMMGGYCKNGHIEDARELFDKMPERDVVSWTTLISGFAQNGNGADALALLGQMHRAGCRPNHSTFASVVSVCAGLSDIQRGKQVHNLIIKTGFDMYSIVGNALVDMYGKCGSIEDARRVFEKMPDWNEISWSAMIAGYVQNGDGAKAFNLFRLMLKVGVKPNDFSFAGGLCACGSMSSIVQGMQIHRHVITSGYQSNIFVGNALVDMYVKCGNVEYGWLVFERMPELDTISWTSLIVGCSQSGNYQQAIGLFCQMRRMGFDSDSVTFSSILSSCAGLATGEQGRQVHGVIIKSGLVSNVAVGSALVNMYAKCGDMQDAHWVFDRMPQQNVVLWNALIGGYGQNGQGMAAVQLFEQMLEQGIKPNEASFLGVISACCHAGLVEEGLGYFNSMSCAHFIAARADHYACIIDLLGRAGCLDEAEDLINNMPFEPDASIWGALLNACRIHPNIELAQRAAGRLFDLEPQNAGPYVLLSNILAAAGRWDDVATVRRMMKDKGVKKFPGCSWIEVNNQVHTFLAVDRSHPQTEGIYAMLEQGSEENGGCRVCA